MKIVNVIAWRDYRKNWKHNLLSSIAIMLTTLMIVTVFSLGTAYWEGITKRSVMMEGADFDVQLPEPSLNQIELAKEASLVKYAGAVLKCAVASQAAGKEFEKTRLYWCDDEAWEKQYKPAFEFFEGQYPQKQNEIVLSVSALLQLGIKDPEIGMQIKNIRYDSMSDNSDDAIAGSGMMDMVLVGFFKDYTGRQTGFVSKTFSDSTNTKLTDRTQGALYISLRNPIYSPADIVHLEKELKIRDDQIIYADLNLRANFLKVIIGLLFLLGAILISGYLFIYNVLYIFIRRRIQFYGQLKALGFSSLQTRSSMAKQMFANLSEGLAGGLIFGITVSRLIVPTALKMMNVANQSSPTMQIPVIVGAVAFSTLVTVICNIQILKTVDTIQPIEAMRFANVSRGGKRKSYGKGKITDIAWKNIFRDRKQAVVILASLSLSLAAFLVMNVIIDQNSARKVLDAVVGQDYRILNQNALVSEKNPIDNELVNQLRSLEGISKIERVYSANAVIPYQENDFFDSYYHAYYKNPLLQGDYKKAISEYKKDPENALYLGVVNGIEKEQIEDIANKLVDTSFNIEDFLNGKVALIQGIFEGVGGLEEAVGHSVTFRIQGQQKEYSIPIVADCTNYAEVGYLSNGLPPRIIVSSRFLKMIDPEVITELVDITYDTSLDQTVEKKIDSIIAGKKGVTTSSKLEGYDQMKETENRLKVLGWSLCLMLGIIALINYTNMIASGIENRQGELSIMRSVGMTIGQVKEMLLFEGLGYWLLSSAISIIAGIPLSYLLAEAMNKYGVSFHIPLLPTLAIFTAMGGCCFFIPILTYQVSPKKTLTQMLQEGN